jgi:hypothetical protein
MDRICWLTDFHSEIFGVSAYIVGQIEQYISLLIIQSYCHRPYNPRVVRET